MQFIEKARRTQGRAAQPEPHVLLVPYPSAGRN